MPKPAQSSSHQTVNIRVPSDWIEALDAWRSTQMISPSRTDVIKLAVLQFIAKHPSKPSR